MDPDPSGQDFTSPFTASLPDLFADDPLFLASQEELRALLFNTARSRAPTRAPTPDIEYVRPSKASFLRDTPSYMLTIVSSPRRLRYLQNYIQEVAPWLDMFDGQRTFGTKLLRQVQQDEASEALLCAILALSARQIERKEHMKDSFESLELYQQSIRLVAALLPSRNSEVIAIAVILCCLEMMSASAHNWRRHLEGCAGLFDSFDVNGFSGGISQAVFWCYARMDLCGALISDGTESTLLPLEKWLPASVYGSTQIRNLFRRARSADMWANYAVYICADACKLLSDRTRYVERRDLVGCSPEVYARRWDQIWEDLQYWHAERPLEMQAVETVIATPFPQILFIHWAAISANQLWHAAAILLLSNIPKSVQLDHSSLTSPLWHAKRICGISQTNPHHGCLNNAIQPLFVAGRMFGHPSEHEALVSLIKRIEKSTGWGMSWRVNDLNRHWGYPEHTSLKPTVS